MTVLPKIPSLSGIVSHTGVIAAVDKNLSLKTTHNPQESYKLVNQEGGGANRFGFAPTESPQRYDQ